MSLKKEEKRKLVIPVFRRRGKTPVITLESLKSKSPIAIDNNNLILNDKNRYQFQILND